MNQFGDWRALAITVGLLTGIGLALGMYILFKLLVGEALAHHRTATTSC